MANDKYNASEDLNKSVTVNKINEVVESLETPETEEILGENLEKIEEIGDLL